MSKKLALPDLLIRIKYPERRENTVHTKLPKIFQIPRSEINFSLNKQGDFISQVPLRLVVHFLCDQRQPERTLLRGRLRDAGNTPASQGRSPLAEHQPITEEDRHENKEGQLKGTPKLQGTPKLEGTSELTQGSPRANSRELKK